MYDRILEDNYFYTVDQLANYVKDTTGVDPVIGSMDVSGVLEYIQGVHLANTFTGRLYVGCMIVALLATLWMIVLLSFSRVSALGYIPLPEFVATSITKFETKPKKYYIGYVAILALCGLILTGQHTTIALNVLDIIEKIIDWFNSSVLSTGVRY